MGQGDLSNAQYVALLVSGTFMYSGLGILSQASKEADGSYAFSLASVVLLAEVCKLCISIVALSAELGGFVAAMTAMFRAGWRTWWPYSIPSILYAVNNNLDMAINLYMDPASEQVLSQMKIFTTALLWWLVFRRGLEKRKWAALVLLTLGSSCAAWPSPGKTKTMWVTSWGILLEACYVTISAIAGVYTEYVQKKQDYSVHLQNAILYIFGITVNVFLMMREGKELFPPSKLIRGYNKVTWLMVANYACMGLCMAQVVKRLDNIHKLMMGGASMWTSAALTAVLFGLQPTLMFCIGLVLVTAALMMFHWPSSKLRSD